MRTTYIGVLAVLVVLSAACQKEDSKPTETSNSAAAVSEQSVVKIDPALAASGEALYNQNCVFCHQPDAIGKPGFAPSLTNKEFLSVSSNKFLLSTIRDGRAGTGMPPFAHLGKTSIEAMVAYLRSHAKLPDRSAEVDAQPQTQGDERLGRCNLQQHGLLQEQRRNLRPGQVRPRRGPQQHPRVQPL